MYSIEERAVNTIRFLAVDAIETAKSTIRLPRCSHGLYAVGCFMSMSPISRMGKS